MACSLLSIEMVKTRSPNTSGAPRIGALTIEVQTSVPVLGSRQNTSAKPVVTNSLPPYHASPPPNSLVSRAFSGLSVTLQILWPVSAV